MTWDFGIHADCPNCGGRGGYHNWPCSGSFPYMPPPVYAPHPPGEWTGATPAKFVTEDDVRRIVREELERRQEGGKDG